MGKFCYNLFWWCFDLLAFLGRLGEGVSIMLLLMMLSFAFIIASPFLLMMAFYYCIVFLVRFIKWLQEHSGVPLLFSFIGVFFGCFVAGLQGSLIGMLSGFFFGIMIELAQWCDERKIDCDEKSSSWFSFGLDDEPVVTHLYDQGNGSNGGLIKARTERPWSWKGFQAHLGPKEDNLRSDL